MAPNIKVILDRSCKGVITSDEAIEELRQATTSTVALEAAARDLLFDFCDKEPNAVHPITGLLEVILKGVAHGVCGSDLPLSILEEAMDTQTIQQCDQLFAFLENNRQTMTARMGRGQTLLRLCNDLLRRLSKTEDTVFCGRILIFLSLAFPLSERSAVNLRGEYNLDNVTTYDQITESNASGSQENGKVDESLRIEDSPELTDAFYTTFWSLQQCFNNPVQLTTAPLVLARFREAAKTVIEVLKRIVNALPKHEQAQHGLKHESNRSTAEADAVVRGHFTPKLLTSRKLLKLELADASFRRQILVQFLIVFDYLSSFTAANKEKWAMVASMPNRSMLNNYVLSISDAEWITDLRIMVADVLKIGRGGEDFHTVIESVLRRDQAWLRWKCNGCQPYDLPPIESTRIETAPGKITPMTFARKAYQYTMGNAVLSKLWKSTGGQGSHEGLETSGMFVTQNIAIFSGDHY